MPASAPFSPLRRVHTVTALPAWSEQQRVPDNGSNLPPATITCSLGPAASAVYEGYPGISKGKASTSNTDPLSLANLPTGSMFLPPPQHSNSGKDFLYASMTSGQLLASSSQDLNLGSVAAAVSSFPIPSPVVRSYVTACSNESAAPANLCMRPVPSPSSHPIGINSNSIGAASSFMSPMPSLCNESMLSPQATMMGGPSHGALFPDMRAFWAASNSKKSAMLRLRATDTASSGALGTQASGSMTARSSNNGGTGPSSVHTGIVGSTSGAGTTGVAAPEGNPLAGLLRMLDISNAQNNNQNNSHGLQIYSGGVDHASRSGHTANNDFKFDSSSSSQPFSLPQDPALVFMPFSKSLRDEPAERSTPSANAPAALLQAQARREMNGCGNFSSGGGSGSGGNYRGARSPSQMSGAGYGTSAMQGHPLSPHAAATSVFARPSLQAQQFSTHGSSERLGDCDGSSGRRVDSSMFAYEGMTAEEAAAALAPSPFTRDSGGCYSQSGNYNLSSYGGNASGPVSGSLSHMSSQALAAQLGISMAGSAAVRGQYAPAGSGGGGGGGAANNASAAMLLGAGYGHEAYAGAAGATGVAGMADHPSPASHEVDGVPLKRIRRVWSDLCRFNSSGEALMA